MSKLAVVFPGIGYTVDKPLLHYSRRLAADAGYEIKLLPYAGFPKKVKGDKGRMADSYRIALEQSKEMLSETDFSVYEEILFIGKSIGTIVAAQLASESPVSSRIRLVLYTGRRWFSRDLRIPGCRAPMRYRRHVGREKLHAM